MTAITAKYKKWKLYTLNLDELMASPNKLRQILDPEAITDLAATMNEWGVIEPIIFRCDAQGNKIVVAGDRRVAAARQAGMTTIPGIFIAGNHNEIALLENIQREALTPVEFAEGLQGLVSEQQYSQEQLGKIVGKARNSVSEILSLNKLPQEIRDDCRGDRTIAQRELVAIAKKKNPEAMTAAYQAIKAKLQQGNPSPRKKDPNDPQAFFAHLDKTETKIGALDTSGWTPDDLQTFQNSLTSLKEQIEITLKGPTAPAA